MLAYCSAVSRSFQTTYFVFCFVFCLLSSLAFTLPDYMKSVSSPPPPPLCHLPLCCDSLNRSAGRLSLLGLQQRGVVVWLRAEVRGHSLETQSWSQQKANYHVLLQESCWDFTLLLSPTGRSETSVKTQWDPPD